MTNVLQRQAVRGLIFAEDVEQLLLIQMLVPDSGKVIWLAPGGGIEAGEAPTTGLFREIKEETGLTTSYCEGPVWRRQHTFDLRGQRIAQTESYYWVPTQQFKPSHAANPAVEEKDLFRSFHWWSVESILRAGRERSGDLFVPLKLGHHLNELLTRGVPSEPVEVGI